MTNALQNMNKVNAGTCPHGMPQGACPICSKMGGGGSLRVGERPQKAGEMSYHECAMLGALMRSREMRIKNHEQNLLRHAQALIQFQNNMEALSQKMIVFANKISQHFIFKPVAYTIMKVIVPILNTIKNIPTIFSKVAEMLSNVKQKFIDIQDKLNAIFGEAKAFVEKKISEIVSGIKKKFEGLLKVFARDNAKDDDTKIDEEKKIFNLKTTLHKLFNRKKKDDSESKSRP